MILPDELRFLLEPRDPPAPPCKTVFEALSEAIKELEAIYPAGNEPGYVSWVKLHRAVALQFKPEDPNDRVLLRGNIATAKILVHNDVFIF